MSIFIPSYAEDSLHQGGGGGRASTPNQEGLRRPSSATSGHSTPTTSGPIQFENYTVASFVSLEMQQIQDKDPDISVIALILDLNNRLAACHDDVPHYRGVRRSFEQTEDERSRTLEQQRAEWSVLSPEILVRGNGSMPPPTSVRPRSSHRRTGSNASVLGAPPQPQVPVGFGLVGVRIHAPTAQVQVQAAHGGVEEETLLEDGTIEEYFAFDAPPEEIDDPFLYEVNVCADKTRRTAISREPPDRSKRREDLGFPSVSPSACFRETLAFDVFSSIFEVVSRGHDRALSNSEAEVTERKNRPKKIKSRTKRTDRKKKPGRLEEFLEEQRERYPPGVVPALPPGVSHSSAALPPIGIVPPDHSEARPCSGRPGSRGQTVMTTMLPVLPEGIPSQQGPLGRQRTPASPMAEGGGLPRSQPNRAHTAMPSRNSNKQVLSLAKFMQ